jgi:hypothetical protein
VQEEEVGSGAQEVQEEGEQAAGLAVVEQVLVGLRVVL